jgi:S-adenosylmethionine:tRNA ribosyltransferase-isomerase
MANRGNQFFTIMHPSKLSIQEFNYHLPDNKIASFPLPERDQSKLLIYKNEQIKTSIYANIDEYLTDNSFLIFNNTKVINARILYTKPTGGIIEIFLLEPFNSDYTTTLTATKNCQWKCFIGGLSKWKEDCLIIKFEQGNNYYELKITRTQKIDDAYIVSFDWNNNISFAEILEYNGNIPLPPYIKRKSTEADKDRYQTIYALQNGSVAAPTAGLHFTEAIFKKLEAKKITANYVTLHVGAGTFKPVTAANMLGHTMHAEWIDVDIDFIKKLLQNLNNPIVAVGTTSVRTIESLYWLGVKATLHPGLKKLTLTQWEVYEDELLNTTISPTMALQGLINWMQINNYLQLITQTQILIAPSYSFKIINAIVTNFHQPQSTLLLLVAAAVGKDNKDNWKLIYEYALQNEFRFLSYGDGSLLFVHQ